MQLVGLCGSQDGSGTEFLSMFQSLLFSLKGFSIKILSLVELYEFQQETQCVPA
jgi:pantothenate kinase-related protein Tda10